MIEWNVFTHGGVLLTTMWFGSYLFEADVRHILVTQDGFPPDIRLERKP